MRNWPGLPDSRPVVSAQSTGGPCACWCFRVNRGSRVWGEGSRLCRLVLQELGLGPQPSRTWCGPGHLKPQCQSPSWLLGFQSSCYL